MHQVADFQYNPRTFNVSWAPTNNKIPHVPQDKYVNHMMMMSSSFHLTILYRGFRSADRMHESRKRNQKGEKKKADTHTSQPATCRHVSFPIWGLPARRNIYIKKRTEIKRHIIIFQEGVKRMTSGRRWGRLLRVLCLSVVYEGRWSVLG